MRHWVPILRSHTLSISFLDLSHLIHCCSKSQKILGLVFRHFYKHSSPETIIRLYTSLVRPILEYCSPVWSPSSSSQTIKLEFIQSFAIKLAYKFHPPPQPLNLHPLFTHRTSSKNPVHYLTQLNLLSTLSSQTLPPPHLPHPFLYHPQNFAPPTCRTSSFSKSFFPSTIKHWNSLHVEVKESYLLPTFVRKISPLIMNSYWHHT